MEMENKQPSTAKSSRDFSARIHAKKPARQRWISEVRPGETAFRTGHIRENQMLVCLSLVAEGTPQAPCCRSGRGREQELELAEKYRATSN